MNRITQIALILLLLWQGYRTCNRTTATEVVVTDTLEEIPFYAFPDDSISHEGLITEYAGFPGDKPKEGLQPIKAVFCTWTYQTFEYKEDSTFIQIGNFQPFYLRNRDHYTPPVRSAVKVRGTQPPKEGALLQTAKPYLRKAKVLAITDLRKDTCWIQELSPI